MKNLKVMTTPQQVWSYNFHIETELFNWGHVCEAIFTFTYLVKMAQKCEIHDWLLHLFEEWMFSNENNVAFNTNDMTKPAAWKQYKDV